MSTHPLSSLLPEDVTMDALAEKKASFGQRLKQLRKATGLTQAELAERAGLSAKSIAALERGSYQAQLQASAHRAQLNIIGNKTCRRAVSL